MEVDILFLLIPRHASVFQSEFSYLHIASMFL